MDQNLFKHNSDLRDSYLMYSEQMAILRRGNYSPDKEVAIFRRGNYSPDREVAILRRGNYSPDREAAILRRGNYSPDREAAILRRGNYSPDREAAILRRGNYSPDKEKTFLRRGNYSPDKEKTFLRRGNYSPDREVARSPTLSENIAYSAPLRRLPNEVWASMSHNQKAHYLKKMREQKRNTSQFQERVQSKKRSREVSQTTSSLKHPEKKNKLETLQNNRMGSNIRTAIIFESYPDKSLTTESSNDLMMALMKLITDNKVGDRPAFCGHVLCAGALIVTCKDYKSKEWLLRNLELCSPWEGTRLITRDPKELEKFKRLMAFVPNPVETASESIKLFEAQNDNILAEKWKILSSKRIDTGLHIVVSIPDSQFRILEKNNFYVYHGFSSIQFRSCTKKKKNTNKDIPREALEDIEEERLEDDWYRGEVYKPSTSREASLDIYAPGSSGVGRPGTLSRPRRREEEWDTRRDRRGEYFDPRNY